MKVAVPSTQDASSDQFFRCRMELFTGSVPLKAHAVEGDSLFSLVQEGTYEYIEGRGSNACVQVKYGSVHMHGVSPFSRRATGTPDFSDENPVTPAGPTP